jgi:hypothetical protein
MHPVGFIIKKYVMMQHGHMNVKLGRVLEDIVKLTAKDQITSCWTVK